MNSIELLRERVAERAEYDRLHRRCMNQRRELRRLNRKIKSLEGAVIIALAGSVKTEAYSTIGVHHRNNELNRKLHIASEQIARLMRKAEAAE